MSRKSSRAILNAQIDKALIAYAVAATGLTAFAPSAAASVVYTPADITFNRGYLSIDLDHDGNTDFTLHHYSIGTSSRDIVIVMNAGPANSQGAAITLRNDSHIAYPSPAGYAIGSGITKPWRARSVFMPSDLLFPVHNRFLGLRFTIAGQVHYGWARISIKGNYTQNISLKLTGYAYESQPNTTIAAGDRGGSQAARTATEEPPNPQPPTLAFLSLGSSGLDLWRQRGFRASKPPANS
jgi:hypothetical protein